jgi:hypothetical protein
MSSTWDKEPPIRHLSPQVTGKPIGGDLYTFYPIAYLLITLRAADICKGIRIRQGLYRVYVVHFCGYYKI